VAAVLEALSPSDAVDLIAAFKEPTITTVVIGRTLRSLGHRIGDDSLRRHRRGVCSCEPR